MTYTPETTRRGFLVLAGLSAVAAACSTPSTPRPGSGKATAAAVDKLSALVPSHVPGQVVKPDIVGVPVWGRDGFTKFPATFVDTIPAGTAGKGGSYKAMTALWGPLPPPLSSNSFFQAVNTDLGATVEFQILDGMTIVEKLTTIVAGGDVVDLTSIPGWVGDQIPGFGISAESLFENLTPYLAGDKGKAYPHLAALPTSAWQWGVHNGKLLGVPGFPTPQIGRVLFYRKDLFDKNGWAVPKNADELFTLGKQITDAKAKRWAFADISLTLREIFRTPREWKLSGGKLVHLHETPELEAAIAFMRKLVDNDLVHPNVLSNKGADAKELFKSGQVLITDDGFGFWTEALQEMLPKEPSFWMQPIPAFGFDGGKPEIAMPSTPGHFTYIKKGTPKANVEELLSIFNYFSAPFGTQEYMLAEYGVEGKHYTRDKNGAPQRTELGNREAVFSYGWLGGSLDGIVESQYPNYVETAATWFNDAVLYRHKDIFDGIRTQPPSTYVAARKPFEDKVIDIIRGRAEVSDLKAAVTTWKNSGGDEGRAFFEKVLRDNGRA